MKEIQEIDVYKFLTILKKNKYIILFNIITLTFLILIISFVIPQKFTSDAMILPPSESVDPLLYGFTGIGEGTASSFAQAFLSKTSTSELWVTILRSRKINLDVFRNLSLYETFNIYKEHEIIETMQGLITIDINTEGVINLHVTTENSFLSQKIAFELIKELDRTNSNLLTRTASNRAIFLEKRLVYVQDSLYILENIILKFSQDYNIINIELETGPIIEVLSTLKAKKILLEIELSALASEITSLHPQRRILQAQLNTLNDRIKQMEVEGGEGLGIGFSVPLESLPTLTLEYARFKRDYTIQNKLFSLLTQEFERAKIAEQKDTPSLKIIDWPNLPEEKSYPKRSYFAFVGVFLGVAFGILFALLKDKIEEELNKKDVREKWEKIIYEW